MPLGRYFIFVGSVLLTLLFVADWYMPQLPLQPARADVDRGIRVQSRHGWPERIVIDTSLPTICHRQRRRKPARRETLSRWLRLKRRKPGHLPQAAGANRYKGDGRRRHVASPTPSCAMRRTDSASRCLRRGERRQRIGGNKWHQMLGYRIEDLVLAPREQTRSSGTCA